VRAQRQDRLRWPQARLTKVPPTALTPHLPRPKGPELYIPVPGGYGSEYHPHLPRPATQPAPAAVTSVPVTG
jgi:hypothetical protein